MNIDLLSISSHKVKTFFAFLKVQKIYGPKGIGALYVRRRPKVKLVRKLLTIKLS